MASSWRWLYVTVLSALDPGQLGFHLDRQLGLHLDRRLGCKPGRRRQGCHRPLRGLSRSDGQGRAACHVPFRHRRQRQRLLFAEQPGEVRSPEDEIGLAFNPDTPGPEALLLVPVLFLENLEVGVQAGTFLPCAIAFGCGSFAAYRSVSKAYLNKQALLFQLEFSTTLKKQRAKGALL